jgi:hypothetical protein
VQALIERGKVDPVAIRELDPTFWELTPFYCPDCGLNYCSRDRDTYVLVDEGFYDCTTGRRPEGHEHVLGDSSVQQQSAAPPLTQNDFHKPTPAC